MKNGAHSNAAAATCAITCAGELAFLVYFAKEDLWGFWEFLFWLFAGWLPYALIWMLTAGVKLSKAGNWILSVSSMLLGGASLFLLGSVAILDQRSEQTISCSCVLRKFLVRSLFDVVTDRKLKFV